MRFMNGGSFAKAVLVGTLIVTISAIGRAQNGAFTIAPLLRSGDPIVGGGSFRFCQTCDGGLGGDRSLTNDGRILVEGALGSGCLQGVYLVSDREGLTVADFCKPTAFGTLSGYLGSDLGSQGQVVLNVAPVVNNQLVDMLLLYDNGQLTKIAAQGDASPEGHVFGDCGFDPDPKIGDNGDVVFTACIQDSSGFSANGVYRYSGGSRQKVVVSGDPSPLGGLLAMTSGDPVSVWVNDRGDVLFDAGQLDPDPTVPERFGLFLARADGVIEKVELGKDILPGGLVAADLSSGFGSINNSGKIAFEVALTGSSSAIFVKSGSELAKIMAQGDPTPVGGTFASIYKGDFEAFPTPRIDGNGSVAFHIKVNGGTTPEAIFLASSKAMVEVAGVGDRLPTGEKIRGISDYAVNDKGQIAFFAHGSADFFNPIGVYLATPNPPSIAKVRVKERAAGPMLVLDGSVFITNDSVIQINGQPVETTYPAAFHENGGTTTRLVSRGPQVSSLLVPGQTVQITVVNSRAGLTIAPFDSVSGTRRSLPDLATRSAWVGERARGREGGNSWRLRGQSVMIRRLLDRWAGDSDVLWG